MKKYVFHDSVESKVNVFDDMNALYEQGIILTNVSDHKSWITKINLAMRQHIYTLKMRDIASMNHPLHRYHY